MPVSKVTDVTGAGDLYAAGCLFGYTQGFGMARSGQLASLAASEVISHVGARPEVNLRKYARDKGML
jgi:sugar/nucleoside kinase (ribokinase family)